uniref:Uncharacterized protein n=1 Tax=Oryza meridionalis TaxID=40149 RepID=A0A0E0D4M2_9ORYZ
KQTVRRGRRWCRGSRRRRRRSWRRGGGSGCRTGRAGRVGGQLPVAEAPRGCPVRLREVAAVGREVGAHQRRQPVVVPGVHHRVPEYHHPRHQRRLLPRSRRHQQ